MKAASIEEYRGSSEEDRVALLRESTESDILLDEGFLLRALEIESSARAKWFLTKALANTKSIASTEAILAICRAPEADFDNTSLHAIAAWSLGRIGTMALAGVAELLSSHDPEVRRCAVDALGEMRSEEALPFVCDAFEHDCRSVRLWAALSLAKIGKAALPFLHRQLSMGDEEAAMFALDGVIKISDTDSLPVLRRILQSDKRPLVEFILVHGERYHPNLIEDIRMLSQQNTELAAECRSLLKRIS